MHVQFGSRSRVFVNGVVLSNWGTMQLLIALFLFICQLQIEHFIPTILYFGYTFVMVVGFWLLTGTIGFYATYVFITKIYAAVKQD